MPMQSGDPIQAHIDVAAGLRQLGGRFVVDGGRYTIELKDETYEAADVFVAAQIVADAIDRANEPSAIIEELGRR